MAFYTGPWYVVVSTGPQLPRFFQVVEYGDPFSWTAPVTLFVEELQFWKDAKLMATQPVWRIVQQGDSLGLDRVAITIS